MGACPSHGDSVERPVRSRAKKNFVGFPMAGCLAKSAGTGEGCCAVVKRTGLRTQKLLAVGLQSEIPMLPFSVCIIGGGAVGLALALRLAEFPGPVKREVHVTVYDHRWHEGDDGKFVWPSFDRDNQTSLEQAQIVTLCDEVVNLLCEGSEAALAVYAADSVIAGERHIALGALEARLLERVQEDDLLDIITLASGPPPDVRQSVADLDPAQPLSESALSTYMNWVEMCAVSHASSRNTILVAADGQDSITRRAFNEYFEWSSDESSQEDSTGSEFVLGVALEEVEEPTQSRILNAALSRAQKRYRYASSGGRGYLQIGLTSKECMQASFKSPQVLSVAEAGGDLTRLFNKYPFLEDLISEGVGLFGVKQAPISSIVLSQVTAGSAKFLHCAPPRSVKLCAIGDAAITPTWWPPGKGLELGLKAADALARVLHKGAPLSAYECFMDQLRWRLLQAPESEIEKGSENQDTLSRFAANVKAWRDAIHEGISTEDVTLANDLATDEEIEQIIAGRFSQETLESLRFGPLPSSTPEVLPRGAFILALDAWAQLVAGKPTKALETCKEALHLQGDDRLSRAVRDCIKLQLGLYEEVAHEESETCDELALWARAEAKVFLSQYEEAVEDCSQALRYSPGSVLCYTVRAEAFLRLGQYADAVEDCNATLARDPDQPVALAVRAEAQLNLNRLDEAVMNCDWALHHGLTASVLAVRGEAHRRMNKLALAIADCNKALSISPDHFNALSVRGEAHLDLGDLNQALMDLDAAIINGRAAADRSFLGSSGGTGDEAAVPSHDAASSSPILAATLTARADTLVRLSQYAEAISDCNEALEIDENSLALAIRAEAELRSGDPQAALEDCNLALTMEKADAYTYVVRAEAYLCLNRATEAMADCDEALEINPALDYGVAVRERAALASHQETSST